MKKGFTLIELSVVIVLLTIIAVITVPKVASVIKENRQKACDSAIKTIIDAATSYTYKNTNDVDDAIDNDGSFEITLLELQQSELLTNRLENPFGGTFDTSNTVTITKSGNIYNYVYNGDECE